MNNNKLRIFVLIQIILFGLALLLLTLTTKNGGVNSDGSYYLRLAKSLVEGNGFYVLPPSMEKPTTETFFSRWPIGFSVLIAVVSKLFQVPVYWGAKLLNLLVFMVFQFIFYKFYKNDSVYLSLIFFFSLFFEVAFSTMSDFSFMVFLALLIFSLHRTFLYNVKDKYLILLVFSGCAMFVTRYVGIVVLPILFLFLFFNPYNRKFGLNKYLIFPTILIIFFIGSYFELNHYLTNDLPNKPYFDQNRSFLTILGEIFWQVFHQVNFLFSILYRGASLRIAATVAAVIFQGVGLYFIFQRIKPHIFFGKMLPFTTVCFITSIIYLIFICFLYLFKAYGFSFRFIVPATFLLLWGVFHQFYYTSKENFSLLKYSFVLFASVSLLFNAFLRSGYHSFYKETPDYLNHLHNLKRQHEKIKKEGIVLAASPHLNYLRLDVLPILYLRKTPQKYLKGLPGEQPVYLNCKNIYSIEKKRENNNGSITKWSNICKGENILIKIN